MGVVVDKRAPITLLREKVRVGVPVHSMLDALSRKQLLNAALGLGLGMGEREELVNGLLLAAAPRNASELSRHMKVSESEALTLIRMLPSEEWGALASSCLASRDEDVARLLVRTVSDPLQDQIDSIKSVLRLLAHSTRDKR